MKMMIGLIIAGLLLLYSSFYFGLNFFDGKVEKDSYNAALNYDKLKNIIEKYHIDLNVNSIVCKFNTCSIDGRLTGDIPLQIKSVILDSPSKRVNINQKADIKNQGFRLIASEVLEGNYIFIVNLNVNGEEVRFEKPYYIKK